MREADRESADCFDGIEEGLRDPEFRRKHPITASLFALANAKLAEALQQPNLNEATLKASMTEVAEIMSWLAPEPGSFSQDEIAARFEQNRVAGFGTELAFKWAELERKKRRGRPRATRHLAVKALDLKLSEDRLSWPTVARRICERPECAHDHECVERVRQQVIALKRFLKRYDL